MGGTIMAFQVITGSSTTLPASMSVAAQDGWLVFGSVNQSGSVFSVLMGRGDGVVGLTTQDPTQSLNSSFAAGAIGPWAFPYPSGSFGIPGLS